jgi:hypothetical protein
LDFPRALNLSQGLTQLVQLAFVFRPLAIGEFERLQQFVQIFHHVLQRVHDAINLFDGFGDGGDVALRRRIRTLRRPLGAETCLGLRRA